MYASLGKKPWRAGRQHALPVPALLHARPPRRRPVDRHRHRRAGPPGNGQRAGVPAHQRASRPARSKPRAWTPILWITPPACGPRPPAAPRSPPCALPARATPSPTSARTWRQMLRSHKSAQIQKANRFALLLQALRLSFRGQELPLSRVIYIIKPLFAQQFKAQKILWMPPRSRTTPGAKVPSRKPVPLAGPAPCENCRSPRTGGPGIATPTQA